ncbi:MAG: CapA family protein [Actinobacteria bacterium]|nr:CapA family protein [Actinomycetota bacterium]
MAARPIAWALIATVSIAAASAVAAAGPADETATSTAAAARASTPPRSCSVLCAGDVLTEDRVMRMAAGGATDGTAYDFAALFAPVRAIVSSVDLAVCHMEVPIAWPGQRPGYWGRSPYGGNLLLSPHEMAESLRRTGFDRCSTASNHSFDLGSDGIASTLAAFDDVGLTHTGTARSPDEAAVDRSVLTVNGVRVAHLSYTRYSNTVLPRDSWQVSFAATPAQVADDVAAVRAAGAQVVIVSVHLSQEMQAGPTADDRAFATQVAQLSDVDLIVHHGPHVVQPVERVAGTVIWWSVGNFVSSMGTGGRGRYSDPRSRDGLFATARLTERSDGTFDVAPTTILVCNEASSRTVRAPVTELADPALPPWLRAEMQQCLDRTLPVVPDLR